MKTLIIKDLKLFFSNYVSILTICILLIAFGIILFTGFLNLSILDNGYANLDIFFNLSPLIFMIYTPAISMKTFSEEYKNGTIELLLSKPISNFKIVLSKYLFVLIIIVFSIIPTIFYTIGIYFLGEEIGNLDLGSIIGSYIGLLLLCSIFSSISIFASSINKQQVNAFLIAILLNVIFYYCFDFFGNYFNNGSVGLIIKKIGILNHYEFLSQGLISLHDVIYFLSVTYLFLFFTKSVIKLNK